MMNNPSNSFHFAPPLVDMSTIIPTLVDMSTIIPTLVDMSTNNKKDTKFSYLNMLLQNTQPF